MAIYPLEFKTWINVPPIVVYDHLRDPYNLVGLQPLLTYVDAVQFGEQDGKKSVSFETVEVFSRMGIVLYRNRIRVQTVFTDQPLQLNTTVHSVPNITLNVKYSFAPLDDGVLVKETMLVHVHKWLAKFVISEATKAQTALLANLKNRLEGVRTNIN